MKKSTILNKGKSIILSPEILDKIRKNKLKTIIIPVFNKEIYEPGELLYCKESYYVIPIKYKDDIKLGSKDYVIDNGFIYLYDNSASKILKSDDVKFFSIKQCAKNRTRTYLNVVSSCICNIDSVSNSESMMKSLNCKNKENLIILWDNTINYYLDLNTRNELHKIRLYKQQYSFENNPMVQVLTIDNVTSTLND